MTRRRFVRGGAGTQTTPAEVAVALREALAADVAVDVLDEVGGVPALAFTVAIHPRGPALIATTPDGRHLGTYADPLAAVWGAFSHIDREAAARAAAPRRGRGRRGGRAANMRPHAGGTGVDG